jgi:hypothetical protein
VILAALWRKALPWVLLAATVLAFMAGMRKMGSRLADAEARLEVQRRVGAQQEDMLDAAADAPLTRDGLTGRLRDGTF